MKRTFLLSTILAAGLAASPALAAGDRAQTGQYGTQAGGQVGQTEQQQLGQPGIGQDQAAETQWGQQQQQQTGGMVSQVVEDEQSVRQLQQALVDEGYNIQVDGIWGPNTQEAVRQFQREQGLQVDGLPGPETLQAMDLNEVLQQHQTAEMPEQGQIGQDQQFQQQQIQQQPGTGMGGTGMGQGGATGIQGQ